MCFEQLVFRPMTKDDIPNLTPIMIRAFEYDAAASGRQNKGPEGYDDGEFLRKRLLLPEVDGYCIYRDNILIGGLLLFIHYEDYTGHLSCIFIDCDKIGMGYGTTAWKFVEHTYPQIKCWTLNTSAVSYSNHCFYINKLGFSVVAVDGGFDKYTAMFRLKKIIEEE